MSMIICNECGKEFSDKAPACPNCGCPIFYNYQDAENQKNISAQQCYQGQNVFLKQIQMEQQYKQTKKKDTVLSVLAAFLSLFAFTAFVSLILAIIDVVQGDETKRHLGSYFAFIYLGVYVLLHALK